MPVPDDGAGVAHCPHCNGVVPRLELSAPTDPPPLPAMAAREVPPMPGELRPLIVCPAGGKRVAQLCLFCPWCEAPLDDGARPMPADHGRAAPRGPVHPAVGCLVAIGILGTILLATVSIPALFDRSARGPAVIGLFVLAFLFAFGYLASADRRTKGGGVHPFLVGLAVIGGACALLLAAGTLVFIVCVSRL